MYSLWSALGCETARDSGRICRLGCSALIETLAPGCLATCHTFDAVMPASAGLHAALVNDDHVSEVLSE